MDYGKTGNKFVDGLPANIRTLAYNCTITDMLFIEAVSSGIYRTNTDALISIKSGKVDRKTASGEASRRSRKPSVIAVMQALKDFHLASAIISKTELAVIYSQMVTKDGLVCTPESTTDEVSQNRLVLQSGKQLSELLGWNEEVETQVEIIVQVPDGETEKAKESEWMG